MVTTQHRSVRIIIACGNAPGVYDCEKGVALGFNKAPFQG